MHVYINGEYNGEYSLMERPDDAFMASYFGGSKEDYDVIKGTISRLTLPRPSTATGRLECAWSRRLRPAIINWSNNTWT